MIFSLFLAAQILAFGQNLGGEENFPRLRCGNQNRFWKQGGSYYYKTPAVKWSKFFFGVAAEGGNTFTSPAKFLPKAKIWRAQKLVSILVYTSQCITFIQQKKRQTKFGALLYLQTYW
jgi:hypothetical protein